MIQVNKHLKEGREIQMDWALWKGRIKIQKIHIYKIENRSKWTKKIQIDEKLRCKQNIQLHKRNRK